MVKKVQTSEKPHLSICEPDHEALAYAAKEQVPLLKAQRAAENQKVTLDPASLETPSNTFIPATSIDVLLERSSVQLSHPLFLKSSQWEKMDEIVHSAKARTFWNLGSETYYNPATRVNVETQLATQLVDQLYEHSGLGLSYDATLQDGLNLQETLDQKRGVCREITYAFVLEARQAGLNAFFIGVDQFTDGRTPYEAGAGHLLAGVLLSDGSVIQVDPTNNSVEAKNCEVHFLSDQEVVSEYLSTKGNYAKTQQDKLTTFNLSEQAIELDPQNAAARLQLLQTARFEDQNAAVAAWQKLGRDFPQNPQIQFSVGKFLQLSSSEYIRKYNPTFAIDYFNQAIKLSEPVSYTEAFIEKAKAYKTAGEEHVDQLILSYLDGLNHEPHNPHDALLLEIHSKIFVSWLEKNKSELGDNELSWQGREWNYEEILEKAKELSTQHTIPLSKKPEMAHWLFEHGDLDDAEYFVLSYLESIKSLPALPNIFLKTTEDKAMDMTLLKGEIAYTKDNKNSAKSIWTQAPYKEQIAGFFQNEIEEHRYPGSSGFYKAVRSAEKLYLMDPQNTKARDFLALVYAQEGKDPIELPDTAETVFLKNAVNFIGNYKPQDSEGKIKLQDTLETMANSDNPTNVDNSLFFLEHFYFEQQDTEALRIFDDFYKQHPNLNPSVPNEIRATHAEEIARIFAKQTNPQDKQRAVRFFHVAATHLALELNRDLKYTKIKFLELAQAKAKLTGNFNFVDQDTITYLLNALLRANIPLPDEETQLYKKAYEETLIYLQKPHPKDLLTQTRVKQVFQNQISSVILSLPKTEGTPDNPKILEKEQILLSILEDKKRLYEKYKMPYQPFNNFEQKAIMQLWVMKPSEEFELEDLNRQHSPELLNALDKSVKIDDQSSSLEMLNKSTLAFLIDGQTRRPEIEQLLQRVAEESDNPSYEFSEDIIGGDPQANLIPLIDVEAQFSRLTLWHLSLAEKISEQIGRPDLAQIFREKGN